MMIKIDRADCIGILVGLFMSILLFNAAWPAFTWARYTNSYEEFSLLMRLSSGIPGLAIATITLIGFFLSPRSWPLQKPTEYVWSGFAIASVLMISFWLMNGERQCAMIKETGSTGFVFSELPGFFAFSSEEGLMLVKPELMRLMDCT